MDSADKRSDRPIRSAAEPLTEADRRRVIEVTIERMILIGGKVYGLEDDAEPEAPKDCLSHLPRCKALCCTYVFALTKKEAEEGRIAFNPARPYYIARDEDGYCPHLDRSTYHCLIHDRRPLRCRKYACEL